MINAIRIFFGAVAGLTLDEADRIYLRLLWFLSFGIGMVFVSWLINIAGYPGINLFLFFLFGLLTLILGYAPVYQAMAFGAGTVLAVLLGHRNARNISRLGVFVLKRYDRFILALTFGESIVFFVLATCPLKSSPSSFFYVLAGAAMLGMIQYVWKIGGNFSKKLLYFYVLSVIFLAVFHVIPLEIRHKLTGSYLTFDNSKTEQELADFEKEKTNMLDEKTSQRIQEIKERMMRGIEPSKADMEFINKSKEEIKKGTVPSKISGIISSFSPASEKGELIAIVPKSDDGYAKSMVGIVALPPGQYCQSPVGKTEFLVLKDGFRQLGDGRNFVIPDGMSVVAIKTEHPFVSIYKGACG